MEDFRRKAFVVTGAASGLGLASARWLAAAGARMVLADLDHARLSQAAEDLRTSGAEIEAVVTDVRLPDQCATMAERALDRFGVPDSTARW